MRQQIWLLSTKIRLFEQTPSIEAQYEDFPENPVSIFASMPDCYRFEASGEQRRPIVSQRRNLEHIHGCRDLDLQTDG